MLDLQPPNYHNINLTPTGYHLTNSAIPNTSKLKVLAIPSILFAINVTTHKQCLIKACLARYIYKLYLVDLLKYVFQLCMHRCNYIYKAGIVFVCTDTNGFQCCL